MRPGLPIVLFEIRIRWCIACVGQVGREGRDGLPSAWQCGDWARRKGVMSHQHADGVWRSRRSESSTCVYSRGRKTGQRSMRLSSRSEFEHVPASKCGLVGAKPSEAKNRTADAIPFWRSRQCWAELRFGRRPLKQIGALVSAIEASMPSTAKPTSQQASSCQFALRVFRPEPQCRTNPSSNLKVAVGRAVWRARRGELVFASGRGLAFGSPDVKPAAKRP
jgi:hypothetical protein